MLGRNPFPPIGELPYLLTLPAHGFFWFKLAADVEPPRWHDERLPVEDLPVLVLFDGWNSFFRSRVVPWRISMAEKTRAQLEGDLLPRFMLRQRWYTAKAESLQRATIAEYTLLQSDAVQWLLALVDTQGPAQPSRYFVPLALAFEDEDEEHVRALGPIGVAKVRQQARMGLLADAMGDEAFCRAIVGAIADKRELRADGGKLRFTPGAAFKSIAGDALAAPTPLKRLTTSSNSVSLLGDRLFLKAYRRLQSGINPELEMGRFLTDVVGYDHCVPVAGSVEFQAEDGQVWSLAMLQAQVTNQGDAWSLAVDQFARLLEEHGAAREEGLNPAAALAERAQVLARRIAELHVVLARRTGDAAFDPEPVQAADLERWAATVRDECHHTLALLGERSEGWSEPLAGLANRVAAAAPRLLERVDRVARATPTGLKTRLHGDLHLQQILVRRDDFVIIDFEGEPQRSVEERRAKQSALRDVAGMLRSFDYARHTALHQHARPLTEVERLAPAARRWERQVRDAFLSAYHEAVVAGGLYADDAAFEAAQPLLDLFELEKALYELRYELDNRPDWVAVPLAGIAALAGLESE
jgi:maltose alpha-D-glucosyltransferase/alpha-amylase